MNEQALIKLVDKILNVCKDEYRVLEKFIDDIEEFHLPTYNQLKDPEYFLETSTTYTQLSATTHYHKVKIAKIAIDIATLLNEIGKYKLTSLSQKALTDLKNAREKCSLYKDALEEHQKGINQILQHLQLCSYTMNSPYHD